jgi:type I phosphodiesterase/nucleotide pyrophosphatase
MKFRTRFVLVVCALLVWGAQALEAQSPSSHKTQNVIVVMMDGMRWQEVFNGAEAKLMKNPGPKQPGDADDLAAQTERDFWRSTAEERRSELMPFLWGTIAKQGQIFGNRKLKSDSHVTNGLNFSYPGYAETLNGFADERINSNEYGPNPDQTVFEWLNAKPEFAGKVAAFGAWDTFDDIFNKTRCGFDVNAGWDPFTAIPASTELAAINERKAKGERVWASEPFDDMPFGTAIEYIEARKPRVLFLGLGEPDEWAHKHAYARYLNSAHADDSYIGQLWQLVQSLPEYRGKTTLIILPDHGRGNGGKWNDHGQKIRESRETWMAFIGPDTAGSGERSHIHAVTESQIAATLAALLGEDYHAAVPKSGEPIADVLEK